MIFSVQRFLEDYFQRRGLADVDQYAIRVANVFDQLRGSASPAQLSREIGSIRTAFFRRNRELDRRDFEEELAATLCFRFKKKSTDPALQGFERALPRSRTRLRYRRRSIQSLLNEFKNAVESRGVDSFWQSRPRNKMRPKPEAIAQALLAVFAKGVLGRGGFVLREFSSGIGFVDVGISFGGTLHLIELKILTGPLAGVNQLGQYMTREQRREGWLVVIDARPPGKRAPLPERVTIPPGAVRVLSVDINPVPPHTT